MSKQEIMDEYWPEFIAWAAKERKYADGFLDIWATRVLTKPTEENFWTWYMEHKKLSQGGDDKEPIR